MGSKKMDPEFLNLSDYTWWERDIFVICVLWGGGRCIAERWQTACSRTQIDKEQAQLPNPISQFKIIFCFHSIWGNTLRLWCNSKDKMCNTWVLIKTTWTGMPDIILCDRTLHQLPFAHFCKQFLLYIVQITKWNLKFNNLNQTNLYEQRQTI